MSINNIQASVIIKEIETDGLQALRTWDEALIVDPELPGIISREDYEKAENFQIPIN